MLAIYKYPLEVTYKQTLHLPKLAKILTVNVQHEQPVLWALVNPANETEERYFETFGTGEGIPTESPRKYIATYFMVEGSLVFHVFECP
jgi:hypothetical protein